MRAALASFQLAMLSGAVPAVSTVIFGLYGTQIGAQTLPSKASEPAAQSPQSQQAAQAQTREKDIEAERQNNRLISRIQAQEQRLKALSAEQSSKDMQQRYAAAKAQCWLDFSRHESLRNNPTRTPELAWLKSRDLLDALEGKQAFNPSILDSELREEKSSKPASATNPKPSERLRPDLWAQLATISSNPGMQCAAKPVACTEVMLVQAEHAHQRIDWRYAQPYFGMAEDGLKEAKKLATACKS